MQNIAREVLSKAAKTADVAEVFITQSESMPVVFEANNLKSLQRKESCSISLRIFKNGRVGFASSNKPGDTDWLVQAAEETAQFGAPASYELPSQNIFPAVEIYDPQVEQISLSQMVKLGEEMITALLGHTPELVCDASIGRHKGNAIILNSKGLEASYRSSAFALGIEGTLINGSDMLFVGESDSSCRPLSDTSKILDTVRLQLERAKTLTNVKSGELPVIFTPDGVASAIVAPLMSAFNGKLVFEGASPLGDKLGQKLFDEKLELYDDATIPYCLGSAPFDDEGVPSRRLPLIKDGAPQNFLYDLKTAAQAHKHSTGHGERHGGLPVPAPRAFVFNNGGTSPADMIAEIKEGLLIEQVIGATQGNILGGDFSGNVLLGYKIENGRIAGRVKDTMVFGNVYELLKNIAAVGCDGHWLGGQLFAPSLYFPALSVSSK
ncbi:MAG: TldD/PmbA family protein [Dehalococcoidia bacterium]|nr:TldD/PmbA family protein [Dehalococcoidia bacterium]